MHTRTVDKHLVRYVRSQGIVPKKIYFCLTQHGPGHGTISGVECPSPKEAWPWRGGKCLHCDETIHNDRGSIPANDNRYQFSAAS